MLLRRGYACTDAGMDEFESIPREYTVDGKHTSKPRDDLPRDELIALVSTNKRVVNLMNTIDPAKAVNPITGKPAVEGAAPPPSEPAPSALAAHLAAPTGPVKEGEHWTLKELQDIRMDAFAEDVPIDLAKMRLWPEDKVVQYFEDGGG